MVTGGTSSGIRRKVDDLGRVVIPAGIRRALNIREGDAVEVSVEGERVVLARPRDACVFCSREDEALHRFRNRLVCDDCLDGIGRAGDRHRAAAEAGVPVPDPIPPSPIPSPVPEPEPQPIPDPQPAPDPVPDPDPAPLPPPGPTPEPEPVPARTPSVVAPAATSRLRSVPDRPRGFDRTRSIDGDALARENAADGRTRIPPRPRPQSDDPASTTAW